jgi:glycosyltransferase involved in cell wall biosynthesis
MACAKPVVITRTRGQRDVVRENETGLYVRPAGPEGLAAALNRLLDEPALAAGMGRAARCIVESELNLGTYLRHMTALVREVAGSDDGHASTPPRAEPARR